MTTIPETRIASTARLQREGRWAEACEFREAERQRLRQAGATRREAVDGSWEAMQAKFPPPEGPTESAEAILNRLITVPFVRLQVRI